MLMSKYMISKLNLNIIDTHNFKTIGVLDTSIYNEDIAIEENLIQITPPGFKYAASPFFMVRGLNIYNSNNVGLTKASCEEELIDLPDGLWKIKYSICPSDKLFIEKVFLKTDKIQCLFTQAFLNLEFSNDSTEDFKYKTKKLNEIDLFIQGAIAAANKADYKLSSQLYKKAHNNLAEFIELSGKSCSC